MTELERIGRLVDRFTHRALIVPSGDDAAVARSRGAVSVTSVDAVVDGVHFQSSAWPMHAVGRKAVAAALSDLAAMGAEAGEVYIASGIPKDFDEASFEQLTDGIAAAADASGAVVAGGDLVAATELWLAVTVVGYAAGETSVATRAGARAGDVVAVTGSLGGAARALELIEQGALADDPRLIKQFAPEPRLAAGMALVTAGVSSMIDISDGLARDATHIAAASGTGIEIKLPELPLAETVADPVYAAASGEEYELLATIPAPAFADAKEAVERAGTALTTIGHVTDGRGVRLVDARGEEVEIRGFDHFDGVDE